MKSNLVKLSPCMGVTALLLFAALAITVQKSAQCQTIDVDLVQKGQITTFDGPGSFATYPEAINPAGVITGYYCQFLYCYGFLRTAEGGIITFDPPDANGYTYPYAINPAGAITGYSRFPPGWRRKFHTVRSSRGPFHLSICHQPGRGDHRVLF
jgi:hypothetical protein